jgi:glycerol uptake facilitator-like aquaporin
MEMIFTALFVSVILAIKFKFNLDNLWGPFAVALTLYGMICTMANRTGGCFNPAVGVVQSLYQFSVF